MIRTITIIALVLSGRAALAQTVELDDAPGTPVVQISLEDMLNKGLKSRRPEDFAYITLIVNKVDSGQLPLSLVRSTFFWSRKKFKRPLQYFQQAMYLRAADIGVVLPSLDVANTTSVVVTPASPPLSP